MNAADLPREELEQALGRVTHATTVKAAVGLLIADGAWLERPEFLAVVDVSRFPGGFTYALIDWDKAVRLTGDPDELGDPHQALMRFACNLAGRAPGTPPLSTLMWTMSVLSESSSAAAVIEAVSWALYGNRV